MSGGKKNQNITSFQKYDKVLTRILQANIPYGYRCGNSQAKNYQIKFNIQQFFHTRSFTFQVFTHCQLQSKNTKRGCGDGSVGNAIANVVLSGCGDGSVLVAQACGLEIKTPDLTPDTQTHTPQAWPWMPVLQPQQLNSQPS